MARCRSIVKCRPPFVLFSAFAVVVGVSWELSQARRGAGTPARAS